MIYRQYIKIISIDCISIGNHIIYTSCVTKRHICIQYITKVSDLLPNHCLETISSQNPDLYSQISNITYRPSDIDIRYIISTEQFTIKI